MADPNPKGPVNFSKPLALRVGRAVKRVEATYGHAPDQRTGRSQTPFLTIQPAKVTTPIPTGTLGSPSTSGRVTIYRDDDAGGLVAAETGATCCNYHTLSAAIAAGKTVSVYWRAGTWWLIAADC